MPIPFFTKHPDEEFLIALDFSDVVIDPDEITGGSAEARIRRTEAAATTTLFGPGVLDISIDATGKIAGISVVAGGGVRGVLYEVLLHVETTLGRKFTGRALVMVDA